ncbi:ABC transporter ATP-binding protein [Lactobacillus crispatus]|uniref:ABC transporter ATP-binding protein n=1 Tax=Lactobacillus crispatus TaxID=47770 RepID=UPI0023A9DC32|nr:ATP-binding cassette domain-containing protein [Lactobacillus crispatus]WEB32077.1 ATP-binding cassette domain-containing protein [Lactobacillus crispatus]
MKILELKHIQYSADKKQILQDVSFKVNKGDFLTLIGPSGAGKSTILRLIANLINANSGDILYQEKNISSLNPVQYRREVSYCFQQPSLFGQTVRDNLIFPYEIRKVDVNDKQIADLLNQVDLSADFLDKKITALSGGEKQRVALIRNIIFLPKILLLDEVTTGLDNQSKDIVHNLIKDVSEKGVTIIQVTHDQSEIDEASNILRVKKGGIIE